MNIGEIQGLRDRIEQLESILGVDRSTNGQICDALKLEPLHAQIMGMLLAREFVTRDGLYTVLYKGRPESEWQDENILDVQICNLLAHLKRNGVKIEIKTKWGEGWFMTREDKAKLRGMISDAPALAKAVMRVCPTCEVRSYGEAVAPKLGEAGLDDCPDCNATGLDLSAADQFEASEA